jgi:hypothetical protein
MIGISKLRGSFMTNALLNLSKQTDLRLVGQMAGEILTEADRRECLLHALAASRCTPGIADAPRSGIERAGRPATRGPDHVGTDGRLSRRRCLALAGRLLAPQEGPHDRSLLHDGVKQE